MKRSLLTLALAAGLALPGAATAQENEGRRLAGLAFGSIDARDRGYVDMGEFTNFGADVFFSMDGNEDGKLTIDEFMAWDYGMALVAEDRDRVEAYETALRVVFAFWDRNGDGEISRMEHRQSLVFDFRRADTNDDVLLTEGEFTSSCSVMVALRAALDPDL